jgi:uncharacterized protein YqjF (DUF2071 family)
MKPHNALLVPAILLTLALASVSSVKADSVVAIDLRGSGNVRCRPATQNGATWRHMENDALSSIRATRADVSRGLVKLERLNVRGYFRGHVAVALGRRSRGTPFQYSSTVRGQASQAIAERDARTNLRRLLYGNSQVPAINEKVDSCYDSGFAARE